MNTQEELKEQVRLLLAKAHKIVAMAKVVSKGIECTDCQDKGTYLLPWSEEEQFVCEECRTRQWAELTIPW